MAAPEGLVQVGIIAEVHRPVVDIACAVLPPLHQALVSKLDDQTYTFEVHQHLDERHVRAITLHRTAGLRRGMPVFDTGSSSPAARNRSSKGDQWRHAPHSEWKAAGRIR